MIEKVATYVISGDRLPVFPEPDYPEPRSTSPGAPSRKENSPIFG